MSVPALPMPQRTPRGSRRPLRWALAASLFLAAGIAVWSLWSTPQAVASPALIEQLVGWNLELAQAGTLDERGRIYTAQEADLKNAVEKTRLLAEDRELAGLLMENGSWLARHDNPIDAAERFSLVADKLVERVQSAAHGKDHFAVDRYAKLQDQVAKRGVTTQLARAEEAGVLDFDNERRLEKVVLRDSKRMKVLIDLLERDPDLKRREIRLALDIQPPKPPKGAPDLQIEVEGPPVPVPVGSPAKYRVKLHNRGPLPVVKPQLVVSASDEVEVVDVRGPVPFLQDGGHLIFKPVPVVHPGGEANFEIGVIPVRPGEATVRAELRAKQLGLRPLWRELKTTVQAAAR